MLTINVAPEVQHFFQYMKKAENKEYTRKVCEVNPLFSWHAIHFCKSWSKHLLLVNDLTQFPIIIPNTTYGQKKQLEEHIQNRIQRVFQALGIVQTQIDRYFQYAQTIQYADAFSNASLALAHHYADTMIHATKHRREIGIVKNNLILAQMPVRKGAKFEICIEKMKKALNRSFTFSRPSKRDLYYFTDNKYHIIKNWVPFSTWDPYVEVKMSYQQFSRYCSQIRKNNDFVYEQFERYLFEYLHLSIAEVDQHLELIETFLDEFLLLEVIRTPTSNYNDIAFFLNHWYIKKSYWSNRHTVQQSGHSLKIFYIFLMRAGEISSEEFKEILLYIQDGVASGLHSLATGTRYDFYYQAYR